MCICFLGSKPSDSASSRASFESKSRMPKCQSTFTGTTAAALADCQHSDGLQLVSVSLSRLGVSRSRCGESRRPDKASFTTLTISRNSEATSYLLGPRHKLTRPLNVLINFARGWPRLLQQFCYLLGGQDRCLRNDVYNRTIVRPFDLDFVLCPAVHLLPPALIPQRNLRQTPRRRLLRKERSASPYY